MAFMSENRLAGVGPKQGQAYFGQEAWWCNALGNEAYAYRGTDGCSMSIPLKRGMIISLDGRKRAFVVRSNACSALIQPLKRNSGVVQNGSEGYSFSFQSNVKPFHICSNLPPERIIGWAGCFLQNEGSN